LLTWNVNTGNKLFRIAYLNFSGIVSIEDA
jgi:hypothetical protein